MTKSVNLGRFHLGVCYYPEHWRPELWDDDFRRMRAMGMTVIRIGEFAWSIFEPEEGRFDFTLFDRAMDLAHSHGLSVILGTPTATPPAWLTQRYPETLNVSQAGVTYQHGQRRHYNYNAAIYRELSTRIADRMAAHYCDHPALLGWQIDNELNCEVDVFYSDADHAAFRLWLQDRYGDLDRLNDAWGAVFWNQTYSHWDQMHLTRPTPSNSPNPHQALDEKRFISDSAIAFARLQAEAIRVHDGLHFITTNGLFGHLDSHRLTDDVLDFISYDSYPNFATIWPDDGPAPLLDRQTGSALSVARDISPQFCVMEQQSGPGGWVNRMEQPSPKPGQMRLWTYQSIAHGADMLLYFRWRTATVGTEIYWHGINDYHNEPNRRCREAETVGEELGRIGDRIVGARYAADVAILRDYDNLWDGELDTWHGPFARRSAGAWYNALQRRHVPADMRFLRPETTATDLAGYRCLIYPHPAILRTETADLLKEYAAAGGTIVFGCRTGYKDAQGHCLMHRMPGAVADLCGVTVDDFTRIGPHQTPPTLTWDGADRPGAAPLSSGAFNDILLLASPDTEVIATYAGDAGYYAGKPALVRHPWGRGAAYYFGGVFSEAVAHALLDDMGIESPLAAQLNLTPEIEVAIRTRPDGGRAVFLLNYAGTPQTIHVHPPRIDLLTGDIVDSEYRMDPYAVVVLDMAAGS
jgi:beta-galactosidase